MQDYDTALDVYDAHECTLQGPCFPAAPVLPPPCATADACRAPPAPQPGVFGASASSTFSGAGNLVPSAKRAVGLRSLTRAQKLAKALAGCRKRYKHDKRKRLLCERLARRRFGVRSSRRSASYRGGR